MNAGRELDALVAEKVMGRDMRKPAGFKYPIGLPYYSTNIAAAWQVVEKFVPHIRVECCADSHYYDVPEAEREPLPWHADIWVNDEPVHCVIAATAPLTICLAALAAVGAEVPA